MCINIPFDCFRTYIASCAYKIVSSPKTRHCFKLWELFPKFYRSSAFDFLHYCRNTYCWKYTNKYMYMVYMTLQRKYFNTAFTTLGFCKFFKSLFYTLNIKDFSSISGAEHKMVVD